MARKYKNTDNPIPDEPLKMNEDGTFPKKKDAAWNLELALFFMDQTIKRLTDKEDQLFFLMDVAREFGVYVTTYEHLYSKYETNKKFAAKKKEVKQILEYHITDRAMQNKFNATMSIFMLKNNYGYTDRQEIDQSVSIKEVNLGDED